MGADGFKNPYTRRAINVEIEAERVRTDAFVNDSIPVDLDAIREFHDFGLEFVELRNCLGQARFDEGGRAVIQVQQGLGTEVTRFTVAHEIAHLLYHLDEQLKAEMLDPANPYRAHTNKQFEDEADAFASALLFPRTVFKADLGQRDVSFAAIEDLAGMYNASLTATAKRFAREHHEIVAFVVGENLQPGKTRLKYCDRSAGFSGLGLFPAPGSQLPSRSNAAGIIAATGLILNRLPASHWFPQLKNPRQRIHEEVRLWPGLDQAAILLWIKDLIEDD